MGVYRVAEARRQLVTVSYPAFGDSLRYLQASSWGGAQGKARNLRNFRALNTLTG
jgi:hypothetical protein